MKTLYKTKYLELKSAPSPDGSFDWVYAHRPNTSCKYADAVIIAAFLHIHNEESIIFIETKRPAIYAEEKAETCLELPAGLIGDVRNDEDIISAAQTELIEETGYKAEKINLLMDNISASAGCLSETLAYVRADIYDIKQVSEPLSDNGVIVKHHIVPLKELNNWILRQRDEGKSISSQALACLYLALK
ncbi:NUDIX hydrolase [bacterium]|nr:NUDIX hydrolase [bacterium]